MSTVNIQIKNLPEIKAAFAKSPAIMGKNLNLAIKKSLFTIQGKSMVNTPVLTGRLRASHRSMFGNLKGEVGTHTNYDVFVHDGTKFMTARPFLLNAVNQSDSDTQKFFTNAVEDTLNEIARAV